jgi:hypothetical protein
LVFCCRLPPPPPFPPPTKKICVLTHTQTQDTAAHGFGFGLGSSLSLKHTTRTTLFVLPTHTRPAIHRPDLEIEWIVIIILTVFRGGTRARVD